MALVVGLPKIGRYLVLLIMCRHKNRWSWYSLIMGRGATNTGGAGIPNTSQQAYAGVEVRELVGRHAAVGVARWRRVVGMT